MSTKSKDKMHPYIPELANKLRKGEISRRDFLHTATLLGVSAGAAYAMAGLPGPGRKAHAGNGGFEKYTIRKFLGRPIFHHAAFAADPNAST